MAATTILELCAGVGMLGEGIAAGLRHIGRTPRVVGYVERDAYAAAVLLARMASKALEPAPVWAGNLEAVRWERWAGAVDCLVAGFPCQPHSMAGSRKGTDDARWIWPAIADCIRVVRPGLVVLENVSGLRSSGGMAPVLADLAALGFRVEWDSVRASDVGAAHQRERVFILAVSTNIGLQRSLDSQTGTIARPEYADRSMGHARANDSEKRGTVAERSTPELVSMTQHWPTPSAAVTNLTESPESWQARADGLKEKHGNGNGAGMPLTVAASAWPTPASRDQKGENSIEHMTNGGGRIMHIDRLPNFVMYHFSHRDQTMTDGPQSLQQDPTSPLRLRLNPQFVDWLMGWLPGMTSTEPTACDAEAMASFRSRLGSHLSYLLGEPGLHRAAA